MRLLALGLDHRSAPTALREAIAFEGPKRTGGLARLKESYPEAEFVLLSTCNRVEIYTSAKDEPAVPTVAELTDFLAFFHAIPPAQLASHLVAHHDEAVIGHLFRVASSLESLVLGEGQILGQVREAFRAAVELGTVGPIFHRVFEHALRVGKSVRESTGLDQGRLSVASVAVDLAREVFDTFSDKTVLVVGAGKMAELTLRHLRELRPRRVMVTNRNPETAAAIAGRHHGEAVPFDRLGQALIDADVVVSTTAATAPVVTSSLYERVQRARRNRLSLILDIAVPRDFDPAIGDFDQVTLYNVDDLTAQVERNLHGRRKAIEPAQGIIELETSNCLAALRHQIHAGVILRELGEYADVVRKRELDRLFGDDNPFSEEQRAAIEHMAWRLQNQFLHHPRTALRSATETPADGQPHPLLAAVRHLFGLNPEEPKTRGASSHAAKEPTRGTL
jgi:glutamyl-tRNA reductase